MIAFLSPPDSRNSKEYSMNRPPSSVVTTFLFAAVLTLTLATSAMATQYAVIYRFHGAPDGQYPTGDLVADPAGNLYGTTSAGGSNGLGSVYQLTPPTSGKLWAETVLYSFATGGDGTNPVAGLVRDAAGNLYGTTFIGGQGFAGTVFELSPPSSAGGAWTEKVLYSFTGFADGSRPQCKLLLAKNGALMGTTFSGGAHSAGTVFKLTPPSVPGGAWVESILYSFTGRGDGAFPWPGVVADKAGNLYGVNEANGVNSYGTAFELSPPVGGVGAWQETILHSFGLFEGANPVGELVLDQAGNVYGMTNVGPGSVSCGTVFQLVPPASKGGAWTENILYTFTCGNDGGDPYSGLVFDSAGDLLGADAYQGSYGGGAIFKLSPSAGAWTETTLHDFAGGPDGMESYSTLIRGKGGAYFGATVTGGGGTNSSFGTIFELKP